MSNAVIPDGRRARGDASRRLVLESATDLASVDGLDGLTIGRLAAASGSSKSSIATLFQSKEGLQLATVAAAREIFVARIIEPARRHPRGVHRLAALLRNALVYSRDRVFTGGCFFAATAADVDSKPGPVSDAVRAALVDWYGYVEAQCRFAATAGDVSSDDVEGLAFELVALNEQANSRSLLLRDDKPYALAAAAMRDRLRRAGAPASALPLLTL
ncbi:TetR family transcriptional regulator C-terminal domain-containing protein [Microbacterium sp. BLY]|uniref:TetR family transcriptional regulator C-terminal domain-containing protein n=1 Tax=Microbacterium sp. BLY TaxID=2823280 RepID=UPI001B31C001|nr:TetR family transcriptional regulator [Microbacterium sp. BLY]MBP3976703.1 TetR family transcriptional regulator [Microbacterium sp. BLY]